MIGTVANVSTQPTPARPPQRPVLARHYASPSALVAGDQVLWHADLSYYGTVVDVGPCTDTPATDGCRVVTYRRGRQLDTWDEHEAGLMVFERLEYRPHTSIARPGPNDTVSLTGSELADLLHDAFWAGAQAYAASEVDKIPEGNHRSAVDTVIERLGLDWMRL